LVPHVQRVFKVHNILENSKRILFMKMFTFYAIILLSGNINTCVVYEQHLIPSMPICTSLLINDH
jgi:flagellar biosynthesis protein FlhB